MVKNAFVLYLLFLKGMSAIKNPKPNRQRITKEEYLKSHRLRTTQKSSQFWPTFESSKRVSRKKSAIAVTINIILNFLMFFYSDGVQPVTLITRIYQIFASSTRDYTGHCCGRDYKSLSYL